MQQKIVCFETLGCRLNQSETEGAARYFREAGFACTFHALGKDFHSTGEVVLCVVNTCAVTGKAEQKCRRTIRLLLHKFPNAVLLLTGCLAQLDKSLPTLAEDRIVLLSGLNKYLLKQIAAEMNGGELDVTSGAFAIERLRSFAQQHCSSTESNAGKEASINPRGGRQTADDQFSLYTAHFQHTSRASLKIQDGCDKGCTFCAIRLARGKSISLAPDEALRRARQIEKAGYAEVVLTGVNLSLYSGEHKGNVLHLGELLEFLIGNTDKIKFRLSSLYPEQITEEFCHTLQNPRVQPFFHLSVQSLCDSILAAMGRSYRKQDVINAVRLLRQCKDNPFISCDLIAGFPGETTDDFRETQQACKNLSFAWIHAFPFSPRDGTSAKDLVKVEASIQKTRTNWLWKIGCEGKVSYIRSCKGCVVQAIVEKPLKGVDGEQNIWRALTDNYLHAVFQCDREFVQGSVVRLMITDPLDESIQDGKEEECLAQLVS